MTTLKLSPEHEREIGTQIDSPFVSPMHVLEDDTYGRMAPGANGTERVVKCEYLRCINLTVLSKPGCICIDECIYTAGTIPRTFLTKRTAR